MGPELKLPVNIDDLNHLNAADLKPGWAET